ncbi:MAG: hypothetical protein IPF56_01270 [Chloroflexi bacterium]|jgi:hypothetical protein|nr:hypothetical protein [Chloroflexota bacterium]MBK6710789.1 hypothetical protein [Chloroflexota bacterium]MBK8933918.1 hypothetical protein [Chloroflexota bacterium]
MPEQTPASGSEAAGDKAKALTPEIVQKVSDKVYALLLEDLRLERERKRRR